MTAEPELARLRECEANYRVAAATLDALRDAEFTIRAGAIALPPPPAATLAHKAIDLALGVLNREIRDARVAKTETGRVLAKAYQAAGV